MKAKNENSRLFLFVNLCIFISILCTVTMSIMLFSAAMRDNFTTSDYSFLIFGIFSLFFTTAAFSVSSYLMKTKLNYFQNKILSISITDDLTSLYNRKYFFIKLNEEFERSRRYTHPLSLIFVNIDSLKTYNEKYGPEAVDLILENTAAIIKPLCRESDIVSRYNDDQFALLLPDTDDKGVIVIAEKLRSRVEKCKYNKINEYITISIGIATLSPDSAYSAETLIYDADTALFRANEEGGNRSVLYTPA